MSNIDKKRVALVSCESFPLIKVGGLADVVGALYKKLKRHCNVFLFLPAFPQIKKRFPYTKIGDFEVVFSQGRKEKACLLRITHPQYANIYLIDNEPYFNREEIYTQGGKEYPDNLERFSFFSKAVLDACKNFNFKFDIFHCHDWQTALLPLYLKIFYSNNFIVPTVFTIHNLSYQGIFPKEKFHLLGLDWEYFKMESLEFYGQINIMKAGIIYSTVLNTVSPTYAQEILTPEYGCKLDGLLSTRVSDLFGILNGIDYQVWNPMFDKFIFKRYRTFEKKIENKIALQKRLKLKDDKEIPIFGLVGRLVEQKGIDILVNATKNLINEDFQLVILGKGEEKYEKELKEIAENFPDKISVNFAFDEEFAHQIYAGSDFFLMPSRFEPCGLGQLISFKYGTIPIVRKTGGLADTVKPIDYQKKTGYGFVFENPISEELEEKMRESLKIYQDKKFMKSIFNKIIKLDFSWRKSVENYWQLYQKAWEKK